MFCYLILESELTVKSHDLHLKSNNTAHHTDEYDLPDALIVRRGQQFTISLNFGRKFKKDTDSILLQFTTGRPIHIYITNVYIIEYLFSTLICVNKNYNVNFEDIVLWKAREL